MKKPDLPNGRPWPARRPGTLIPAPTILVTAGQKARHRAVPARVYWDWLGADGRRMRSYWRAPAGFE